MPTDQLKNRLPKIVKGVGSYLKGVCFLGQLLAETYAAIVTHSGKPSTIVREGYLTTWDRPMQYYVAKTFLNEQVVDHIFVTKVGLLKFHYYCQMEQIKVILLESNGIDLVPIQEI